MDNIDYGNYMLTTLDNPYSPFTEWDEWLAYDTAHGYDTCGTLARFALTGDTLTEDENAPFINDAMNEIIDSDPYCRWIKVTKDSFEAIKNKIGPEKYTKILENAISLPKNAKNGEKELTLEFQES